MKRLLMLLLGCLMTAMAHDVFAGEIKVDLYKTNQFTVAEVRPIVDAYRQKIKIIHDSMVKGDYKSHGGDVKAIHDALEAKVNRLGKYAYFKIDFVIYPNDPNDYLTINVVDKGLESTLPIYNPKPTGHYGDPGHLIRAWNKYESIAMPLYISGKLSSNPMQCTEFHCLGVFGTPTLKKYEAEFNNDVPKYQVELVEILKNDSDRNKRAAVVFLLAHTKNEAKLIDWLLSAMNDSDENVRNNVVRVLGFMTFKDKNITLPVDNFIKMLSSPILTDRNKALTLLFGLSQQPRYAKIIKAKAGQDLMDSLHMEQPNLHNSAYLILQSMSGQHYSDRDYAAWSHWLGLS